MLILSRKLGEKIIIGHNIEVVVVDIDRGKVRLGIEAPAGIPIHREEILNRIKNVGCTQCDGRGCVMCTPGAGREGAG